MRQELHDGSPDNWRMCWPRWRSRLTSTCSRVSMRSFRVPAPPRLRHTRGKPSPRTASSVSPPERSERIGDFAGGSMFLLTGVLAALFERERSGQGQVIDASIVDGTASLTAFVHGVLAAGLWRDERGVNPLDTGAPYYDVYETADGQWLAVGAIEPAFFAELIRLLDIEDAPPQHDQSRWGELRSALAQRFAQRTRDEWMNVFAATDACVAPVLSFAEA